MTDFKSKKASGYRGSTDWRIHYPQPFPEDFARLYRQDADVCGWLQYTYSRLIKATKIGCWWWLGKTLRKIPTLLVPVFAPHYGYAVIRLNWLLEFRQEGIPTGYWLYRCCPTERCVNGQHYGAAPARRNSRITALRNRNGGSIRHLIDKTGHLILPDSDRQTLDTPQTLYYNTDTLKEFGGAQDFGEALANFPDPIN